MRLTPAFERIWQDFEELNADGVLREREAVDEIRDMVSGMRRDHLPIPSEVARFLRDSENGRPLMIRTGHRVYQRMLWRNAASVSDFMNELIEFYGENVLLPYWERVRQIEFIAVTGLTETRKRLKPSWIHRHVPRFAQRPLTVSMEI